jgi:hypothetical protein
MASRSDGMFDCREAPQYYPAVKRESQRESLRDLRGSRIDPRDFVRVGNA